MADSCKLDVKWDMMGRIVKVRGPAYRMIELPIGAKGGAGGGGEITKYTPDWARIGYEKMSDCVSMDRARQSGHEIEGSVKIKGKRYSAFTSGGDDARIIVRTRKRK